MKSISLLVISHLVVLLLASFIPASNGSPIFEALFRGLLDDDDYYYRRRPSRPQGRSYKPRNDYNEICKVINPDPWIPGGNPYPAQPFCPPT